jgi:hypothetical protein
MPAAPGCCRASPGRNQPELGESLEELGRAGGEHEVAVEGEAGARACRLAFHGDLVLAARSAKFLQAFAKLGLIPDAGGTWLLHAVDGAYQRHRQVADLPDQGVVEGFEGAREVGLDVGSTPSTSRCTSPCARLSARLPPIPTAGR